jgi:hypothetical protein
LLAFPFSPLHGSAFKAMATAMAMVIFVLSSKSGECMFGSSRETYQYRRRLWVIFSGNTSWWSDSDYMINDLIDHSPFPDDQIGVVPDAHAECTAQVGTYI